MDERDDEKASKLEEIRAALKDDSEAKVPKAPRKRAPKPAQLQSMNNISVGGSHNVVGNIVNFNPKPARTRVVVRPGDGVISSAQASKLQGLVREIVELEAKVKRDPATFRAVWGSLNRKMAVASYRELPAERFEAARKFLSTWLGRLNSGASARVKDGDNWRKRYYAYIKANTKDPEDVAALADYLKRNFKGAQSLTDLANDDLERVYRYVAGRRNRRR